MYSKTATYLKVYEENRFFYWKPIVIFLMCALVLSSLALDKEAYVASQLTIFLKINKLLQFTPQEFWHNVTYLGDALILVPLLSFICLINKQAWAAMFGAVPLALAMSHLGKAYFAIPRPAAILDHQQFTIIGNTLAANTSFPSGHTITIFTAVFALIFVLLRNYKPANSMKLIIGALVTIATIVAISRVAVGAHWPTDLLLGAIVGYIAGLSGEYLSRKYRAWWEWINNKPLFLGLFILCFCLILVICTEIGKYPDLLITWGAIAVSGVVGSFYLIRELLYYD